MSYIVSLSKYFLNIIKVFGILKILNTVNLIKDYDYELYI